MQLRAQGEGRAQLEVVSRPSRALIDAYLAARCPSLVPRQQLAASAVAELMGRSGYVGLRAAGQMDRAWHERRHADSADLVYRAQDGQLLGHASLSLVYSNTWMCHQLATLAGHAETGRCRRHLYEWFSSGARAIGGDSARVLAYHHLESRWHQRFIGDFVSQLGDSAQACRFAWDCYEQTPLSVAGKPADACVARAARPAELPEVANFVKQRLPAALAAALDIMPDRLRFTGLGEDAERGREALVISNGDRLLGVALCETGCPQASLFDIFQMAHVFPVPAAPPEATLALLTAVRTFYRRRGIARPLVLTPEGGLHAAKAAGLSWRERMGAFATAGEGAARWEAHCRLHMGRLYRRSARIRRPHCPPEVLHAQ